MFRMAKEDFLLLKKSGKHIILFELIYKLAATAVVFPLAAALLEFVLKLAGISYLTNEYILKAFTNPFVTLTLVFFLLLFVMYCCLEMAYLTACFETKRKDCKISIVETSLTAVRQLTKAFGLRHIPLAIFYFFMIFAINITICLNVIYSQTAMNLFKTYVVHNGWLPKIIVIAALLVLYGFAVPGIYSFIIFMLENVNFRQAYKKSAKLVKRHLAGSIFALAAYNLAIVVVISFFYVLISLVLIAGVKILNMAYLGSAIYLSVLKYVRNATKLFLMCIAIPVSYTVIASKYYSYSEKEGTYDSSHFEVVHTKRRYYNLTKRIYFPILTVLLVINGIYVVTAFNKNPFEKIAIFHETKITAHRGTSVDAPENTLESFSKAIDDMSDYIELDVQLTKDGAVVVMHDKNAYRTTGVDKNISDMTLEEVKQLDAGSYFGEEFAGEQVPTLREVLELVNGRVALNIELKSTSANLDKLTQKVVELIHEYDIVEKCVITSLDYYALKYTKRYDEKIQTGYILSVAYGDFYNMESVDFFSVNASFLSKRTVDAIHNAGKQVYAWTVNNDTSIKNLTNKGVDNIITDNPVLAREVIYSRDTSETMLNMIKYVFNQ
jgi:glycerophosphoryl diester phosphodiesterase